jgi:hypothetical protein
MQSLFVTNSTLYSLLQTVHANQTQEIIPKLSTVVTLRSDIAALRSELTAILASLDAKLDQISLQVTPPETVDLNLDTAIITQTKE